VNTHIQLADCRCGNVQLRNCYQLGLVVFWGEVASAMELAVLISGVEVHLMLYVSSLTADCLRCQIGKEGFQP